MRSEEDFPVGRGLLMTATVGGLLAAAYYWGAPVWGLFLVGMVGGVWMRLEVLTWRLEG